MSGATARYSGDISSWAWTQYGQTAKAYAFSYDGAHRLTAGQYYTVAAPHQFLAIVGQFD